MLSRILAIMRKEFVHIFRDYRSLMIILVLPILMLLLFGNVISLDPRSMAVGFVDQDRSQASRQWIQTFEGSNFFEVRRMLSSPAEIETALKERQVKAVIVIPPEFEKRLAREPRTIVQLVTDASDTNSAALVSNFVLAMALDYAMRGSAFKPPIDVSPRILYNPDGKTMYFILPGIAAVVMLLISALLTSLALVREKETGTLEQILVSPLSSTEIVLGKVIPYLILAFIDGLIILGMAYLIYRLPFRGSLPLLLSLNLLYILTGLAIGLVISSAAKTQLVAILVTLVATIMPTILLSGFMFPIESMPPFLQGVSAIIPARYFLVIIRGILVKGVGMEALIQPTLAMAAFSVLFLGISIKTFKSRLQ